MNKTSGPKAAQKRSKSAAPVRQTTKTTSKLRSDFKKALDFLPQHRAQHSIHLDEVLEQSRSMETMNSNVLDLILMSYRFYHLYRREKARFNRKKLSPPKLEDLWLLCFAALMSRDKNPHAALVSEAVELSREIFGEKSVKLSNAFLRGVTRNLEALKSEIQETPQILLGEQLQRRWKNEDFLKEYARKISCRPEAGILAFDQKLDCKLYSGEDFLHSDHPLQAMNSGSWSFCDWASKEIQLSKDSRILDACASPGGKLIYWMLRYPKASFFATDAKQNRLEMLRHNLKRFGLNKQVEVANHTWGQGIPPENIGSEKFDLILADLPCSGLGTLARRPDILLQDPRKLVEQVSGLQKQIIEDLLKHLSENGRMLVSLCSVDPQECGSISKLLGQEIDHSSFHAPQIEKCDEAISAWIVTTP